jgi:CRISPR/Cas system-associated exonuclease Cas4 (RecB family)
VKPSLPVGRPVTAWSYSRLMCFEKCPREFNYRYIQKLPEPKSPAMDRGIALHANLEEYIKAKKLPRLLPELKLCRKKLAEFKKLGAVAERELAFTRDWKLTGWFDPNAWVRAKIDLTVPLAKDREYSVDYKSGRANPEKHVEQMQLYGNLVLLADSHTRFMEHGLWYVDHHAEPYQTGVIERYAPDLKRTLSRWTDRAMRIFNEKRWPTRPSPGNCKWCPYSVKKGGPCKDGM